MVDLGRAGPGRQIGWTSRVVSGPVKDTVAASSSGDDRIQTDERTDGRTDVVLLVTEHGGVDGTENARPAMRNGTEHVLSAAAATGESRSLKWKPGGC
jgi:hypothetical protein